MTSIEGSNDFLDSISESGFTLNATGNSSLNHTANYHHKHLPKLIATLETINKNVENHQNINVDHQSITILRYYVEGVILLPVSIFGLLGRCYHIPLYNQLT